MKMKLVMVVIGVSLLAACSSPAQRISECEAQGISKDTCYLAEQNKQASINAAAEKQALENAANAVQHAQTTHKHREELAKSGCTQVAEANGECSTKPTQKDRNFKQLSSEAEAVMNGTINDGSEFLLGQGWKPNEGKWHKQGYTLTLVVEKGIIVNSQLSK
ncbi:hypothetical protein [Enterobacter mori]|uniref:hypothetical protein n=1 Tax=Enterobacter mori TaxID=539813 RepID=UPI001B8D7F55|nr:hypothetical protein [Enterobacter mori]